MSLDKTFFADSNADYEPNGQAVDGESSLVSGLVVATNTSPFPVGEITVQRAVRHGAPVSGTSST